MLLNTVLNSATTQQFGTRFSNTLCPLALRSNKLRHYGVRGIVIYWFTSYLTGRKQISIFIGTV